MKSHEIVQEYLRKYSLPDTSQRITNIFIKIFSQNFFSSFFSKYFFPNFFVKIFLKIFFQNFFPNFFSKFFFKIFLKIFSRFVSRVSHARHTRVAITQCETHACWEHPTRDFSRDYINENFFVKFFSQFFFPNFFSESFFKIYSRFVSWVSHARHACCDNPMRDTRVLRAPHAGFFS